MLRLPSPALLAVAGAFALAAGPAAASAQDAPPMGEYRTAVMQSIRHHNGALRQILEGEVPFEAHVVQHARAIRDLSVMAGDMFPEGSGEGTRAKPEVWTDHEGFMDKLRAFQAAAASLAESAEGGDEAAVQNAAGDLGRSCRGCHTDYRAEAN